MTKAQKENQARFKKVQAEAKKLKAKNPKLAHTEAVKKAWAIIAPKSGSKPKTKSKVGSAKKTVAKKKVAKKISGKLSLTRKETRLGYVGKVPAKKKAVKKIGAVKKKPAVVRHKDVKSHNVRISVMSGIGKSKAIILKKLADEVRYLQMNEDALMYGVFAKGSNAAQHYKKVIKETKEHIKELKKLL